VLSLRQRGASTVSEDKALLTLQLLVEGNSLRSTERIEVTCDVQRAGTWGSRSSAASSSWTPYVFSDSEIAR
jgi:hypothetical protein